MKKLLFGVTGIGLGHTMRELPLIDHFLSQGEKVVIFAYDSSLSFFTKYYKDTSCVCVIPIAVPFYVGTNNGLDFRETKNHPANQGVNFFRINCEAFEFATKHIGKPDLVISDYEPISAQYAYMYQAPFVTFDQQSKYLTGDFLPELGGFTYKDEVVRLSMFFPKVDLRFATSFFTVNQKPNTLLKVTLVPPILNQNILSIRKQDSKTKQILVYISPARDFPQSVEDVIDVCSTQRDFLFHLFIPNILQQPLSRHGLENITLYSHGDPRFHHILSSVSGVISTAGHSLLSEAMYLEIPVYAIPVAPYEQHMNAKVIADNDFGLSSLRLEKEKLDTFISCLSRYRENIREDKKVLLRGSGKDIILPYLENILSQAVV